ncbi:hypothetical protein AVEN_166788-1 [Araneus ventricosus]|uniref:Uncharacterized protein n=1 Tax=Araneus ventricosus TaxID=182803 RepID=A0A4Y2BNG7_ARAVE|nr:hypothetical protein AVEN_166788-1 [Araneus ventricosus]
MTRSPRIVSRVSYERVITGPSTSLSRRRYVPSSVMIHTTTAEHCSEGRARLLRRLLMPMRCPPEEISLLCIHDEETSRYAPVHLRAISKQSSEYPLRQDKSGKYGRVF